MKQIIQVDGADLILQLFEFIFLAFGWFSKGLFFAIGSELIFRPIARKFKKILAKWQEENPIKTATFYHYWSQHLGHYHNCQTCNPRVSGVAAES